MEERRLRAEDIKAGDTVSVNGSGDLYFEADFRPFIGENVTVVQRNKNGLYLVRLPDGKVGSFALRNLSPPITNSAESDDSYRQRLIDGYGMWGALTTEIMEGDSESLDAIGRVLNIPRRGE